MCGPAPGWWLASQCLDWASAWPRVSIMASRGRRRWAGWPGRGSGATQTARTTPTTASASGCSCRWRTCSSARDTTRPDTGQTHISGDEYFSEISVEKGRVNQNTGNLCSLRSSFFSKRLIFTEISTTYSPLHNRKWWSCWEWWYLYRRWQCFLLQVHQHWRLLAGTWKRQVSLINIKWTFPNLVSWNNSTKSAKNML